MNPDICEEEAILALRVAIHLRGYEPYESFRMGGRWYVYAMSPDDTYTGLGCSTSLRRAYEQCLDDLESVS